MSEQAQIKALAAAQAATDGLAALLRYGRDGGLISIDFEHDAVQQLADATRLALEALSIARDELTEAEQTQLMPRGVNARLHGELESWIHA